MLIQPNAGDWMPSTEKWLSRLQSNSGPASLSSFNSLESFQTNQSFSSSKAWTNASERIGAANIFHSSLNKNIGLYVLRMPMPRAGLDESMVLSLIQARAPKVGPLHLLENLLKIFMFPISPCSTRSMVWMSQGSYRLCTELSHRK